MPNNEAGGFKDPGFTLATFQGGEITAYRQPQCERRSLAASSKGGELSGASKRDNDITSALAEDVAGLSGPTIEEAQEIKREMRVGGGPFPDTKKIEPAVDPITARGIERKDEDGSFETNLHVAIKSLGATFYDQRSKGGCLWIVADSSGKRACSILEACGMRFKLAPKGGSATGGNPAWWSKDPDPKQFFSS